MRTVFEIEQIDATSETCKTSQSTKSTNDDENPIFITSSAISTIIVLNTVVSSNSMTCVNIPFSFNVLNIISALPVYASKHNNKRLRFANIDKEVFSMIACILATITLTSLDVSYVKNVGIYSV